MRKLIERLLRKLVLEVRRLQAPLRMILMLPSQKKKVEKVNSKTFQLGLCKYAIKNVLNFLFTHFVLQYFQILSESKDRYFSLSVDNTLSL